jgi:hypothetical protein
LLIQPDLHSVVSKKEVICYKKGAGDLAFRKMKVSGCCTLLVLTNICLTYSFVPNRMPVTQVSRIFAVDKNKGKKEVVEEAPKKRAGSKQATVAKEDREPFKPTDIVRGVLWATTPWIFNSYEDTKNYVEGKPMVKITVKDKVKRANSRNEGVFETEGRYNEADPSRAPIMSGERQEALDKNFKKGKAREVVAVDEEKVSFTDKLSGFFAQKKRGSGGGVVIGDPSKWKRPKKVLILYEYEGSPYCQKVREAMSMLDLTVEYRPCPNARYGFSDDLSRRTSGARTVPFLVDPGNSMGRLGSIGESDRIVEYLFDYFGPGVESIPASLKGKENTFTTSKSKLISNLKESNLLQKPLELYGE